MSPMLDLIIQRVKRTRNYTMWDIKTLFSKIRGSDDCPPRANLKHIVLSSLGVFVGIAAVA